MSVNRILFLCLILILFSFHKNLAQNSRIDSLRNHLSIDINDKDSAKNLSVLTRETDAYNPEDQD